MQKRDFFFYLTAVLLSFATAGYSNSAANFRMAPENFQERQATINTTDTVATTDTNPEKKVKRKYKYIRGIHISAWASGSKTFRKTVMDLFDNTELNTAVIDIKEYEGQVYISGIKIVNSNNAYVEAIPDLEKYVSDLKEKGIYTIARIVVFRDNTMTRKNPELAVKNPDNTIWTDRKGVAWLDPYNKNTWDYNLQIAERAANIGFDEIQFDYIRFPSDGNTKNCRYSKPHCASEALNALIGFLKEADRRLKAKGVKISIDVFGLTTTATDDMGIGQKIVEMAEWADYICPMVYPSHYRKWNYGIEEPNKEPYRIVYLALEDALKRIPSEKLRPWLQDFSLGYKYGRDELRAQIQACYDNKVNNWLLWNPRCIYTKDALKIQDEENVYQDSELTTV